MGASRAVLLPRIKPRRRYFGGGSENEDPTGCTTPHPDKKTRSRAPRPRAELTPAPSEPSLNRAFQPVVSTGDAGRRPGRHDGTASDASETTSSSSSSGFFPGNDGSSSRNLPRSSRRERLELLRVETRAAGTRAVRAAVAADHEGRVEAAARDYAVSLKHFDVYLRLEQDAALAEAVRSKAEQYRARLARIREVLTRAYSTPSDPAAEQENQNARRTGVGLASRDDAAADADGKPSSYSTDTEKAETEKKTSPGAPRQPLRAIQHAAPGRFVVTLASAVALSQEDTGKATGEKRPLDGPAFGCALVCENLKPAARRDATEEANPDPNRNSFVSSDRLSSSSPSVSLELKRVTDDEADAWVEEDLSPGEETDGKEAAVPEEKRVDSSAPTEARKKNKDGAAVRGAFSSSEEHPPPPLTPPARPAVSQRARSRRRAYWDAEFPGLLAFESPEDHFDDDDDSPDDEDSLPASGTESLSANSGVTNSSSDFFFFESAVDDAVHKFNNWFDASLRVLGDSIVETGSAYAPKVEHLFKQSVSAIDREWRAQFPDDHTYVSEMSKKEYPSEAYAVMMSPATRKSDEKEKRALENKGARAD